MAFLRLEMSTPAFRFQGKPGPACLGLTEFVIICCFGVLLPLHKPCDWWEGDHVPRLWHDRREKFGTLTRVSSGGVWGTHSDFGCNLFEQLWGNWTSFIMALENLDLEGTAPLTRTLSLSLWALCKHRNGLCKEDPMKRYYSEKRIDERNMKDRCSLVKAGSRSTDFFTQSWEESWDFQWTTFCLYLWYSFTEAERFDNN